MNKPNNKLQNHQGRFTSITVNRKKTGQTSYCAKVLRVTDKTVRFRCVNSGAVITAPLANVVGW